MLVDRVLANTREEDLERELAKLKTKVNMLRYYAHQQLRFYPSESGASNVAYEQAAQDIWKVVVRRLDA